ncbi:AMP-binding protein [Rhodoferax sp.]|uniref:AMP-binding protein n=1 Tax=Rhodoferax sp. TaxID=50421 RepID=UPI00260ED07F|nr:AMP-binding protein [Rhodoferax sp.]MDD2919654.1 AMP-binding protein [Rhodoferax sp.]
MTKFRNEDVWFPTKELSQSCNLTALINRMGLDDYDAFLRETIEHPERYWQETLRHFDITFSPPARAFVDTQNGPMWARFFPGAGFNIAVSCLRPPTGKDGHSQPAILAEDEQGHCESLSYGELSARTRALASGLASIGVEKGDRVGLLFPSTSEAVVTLLAVCYLGAVAVPLYSGFGADAVARRLSDCEAKVLIVAHGFERKGRYVPLEKIAVEAVTQLPSCQLVVAYDSDDQRPVASHHRWQDLANSTVTHEPAATLAEDPCMILYTSGTSGKPKGAIHRHGGFPLRVAQDTAFIFDFKQGERYFWPSDMGWMVGPYSTFASLILKGALVLYSGAPDVPNIGRLRATAIRQGVTHFGTTPTAIRSMAVAEQVVLTGPAPSIRVLMTGGEVMDEDAHAWLFHRFGEGKLPIINYTGGTECSGAILTNVVLRPIYPCRFNSTAPGVDAQVIDEGGHALIGQPGELAIRKPFNGMTAGFWGDPTRYVETYWSSIPDTWVHGDLALQEEDGQFLLLGRSDDVMKISGRRVGPSEIEGIVIDGRIVSDAVSFGVPNSQSGEAMIVFAVPGPEAGQDPEDRIEQYVSDVIRKKMGTSYRPQAVVTLQALIKTRNGKLVRRLARQAWLGQPPGDLSAVEDPTVFDQMAAICAQKRAQALSS